MAYKTFDASVQTVTLNDGSQIPQVGFGTFKIDPADTQRAVEEALEIGYRHIDTASAYANEAGVGAALRATGMVDAVYTVTKLRNADQGYDNALRACETSLADLGLDRIDLYLLHWPLPMAGLYVETWRAFSRLLEEGLVGSIGVCNFLPEHLDRLIDETGVIPAVNQVESHPAFWRPELESLCRKLGVVVEAYSPLGRGSDIDSAPACAAAERLGVTPAQVVLRWHIQKGHVIIPKTSRVARMRENLDVFGFELTVDEVAALDALDCPEGKISGDPNTFDQSQTLEDMVARGNVKLQ